MDRYGRPQAPPARRSPAPNVSFLNERPKSSSFSSGFTAPVAAASVRIPGEPLKRLSPTPETSNLTSNNDEAQGSNPPGANPLPFKALSGRFTSRPHSGGIRRPEPAATPATAPALKPRPRTAREGMRSTLFASSSPLVPSELAGLAPKQQKTSSEAEVGGDKGVESAPPPRSRAWLRDTDAEADKERPETDDSGSKGDSRPVIDPDREQLYISQLKDDIRCLHQLRETYNDRDNDAVRSPGDMPLSFVTPHTANSHVNNVLLMRDRRTSGQGREPSPPDLTARLRRYNFSADPAQLVVTKTRLEAMLETVLVELVRDCNVHREEDAAVHGGSESDSSISVRLMRPRTMQSSSPLPFANGCGTSAGSIYTGALLVMLDQAERLKQAALASVGEQALLAATVEQQSQQLVDLREQLAVFKDVLSRARIPVDADADRALVRELRADAERLAAAAAASQDMEKALKESHGRGNKLEQKAVGLELELARARSCLEDAQATSSRLEPQVKGLETELRAAAEELESAQQQQQQSEASSERLMRDLRTQITGERKRRERLEAQLSAANERFAALEKTVSSDKTQLRRDREELEHALAVSKKETTVQSAERQRLLQDLSKAQQQLRVAESERDSAVCTVEEHMNQLDASKRLALELRQSLQQAEARASTLAQELDRQQAVSRHLENQMQLLEGKLSRSIALDADEWQRKRQEEQSTWHQQLAALEHSLAAEKQRVSALQQRLDREKSAAKETAEHSVARARVLSEELTTANLCIAERKKQWEALKAELKDVKEALERERSARMDSEALLKLEVTESEKRARRQLEEAGAARSELEVEQQRSEQLVAQIGSLEARIAEVNAAVGANSADKGDVGGTPRRQAQVVADLRVELSRAKQKIAALEEKLAKRTAGGDGGSARRDKESIESKLGAREKRLAEEQRAVAKLQEQLEVDKRERKQRRGALDAVEHKQREDKGLLASVISLLASKLRTQMALFAAVPGEIAAAASDNSSSSSDGNAASLTAFLADFRRDRVEQWRAMEQLWEALRAELENADWQLAHMKNRLEELHLEYVGCPSASLATESGEAAPGVRRGAVAVAVRPFAEAVAAGKETVAVADQLILQASGSTRSLRSPSSSPERRALRAKAEEQETFALALAQEMRAMKERYEAQLEETRVELRAAQRLRADTAQRLHGELDAERQHHQQTAAQLGERVAALEAQLAELTAALDARRTAEVALLERVASARSEAEKREATQELVRLVDAGCADERARRERARGHSYCGASSVTVSGRDALPTYRP